MQSEETGYSSSLEESPLKKSKNLKFLKGERKHTRSEAVDNRIIGIGSQI
ncbi:MAG: hypothetical protein Ct9H300mP3_01990 [Gammaproteobacteria bacterium]|nr:MAG: hypothetical protein Ct9H300mP3_01990 [Gammaproteobacteria bacterium]